MESLHIPYSIEGRNTKKQELRFLSSKLSFVQTQGNIPQSSQAIYACLEDMSNSDTMLTLPSSKDQITDRQGRPFRGHTDLLRSEYKGREIVMTFVSPKLNVALLSDHISLGEVEKYLEDDKLESVLKSALEGFSGIRKIKRVFVAGVNPHCGEGGIISGFDSALQTKLEAAESSLSDVSIKGLFPGDTILFNPVERDTLFVFAFHDQGLAPFKLMNGLTGINLTLGLPFRRVSVDHGTAFDLFGKNAASYQGMLYLMDEVLSWE